MSINGAVFQPTGQRLQPNVPVVLTIEATGEQRKTQAPFGIYVFAHLQPGCYIVSIDMPPFVPVSQRVIVPSKPSEIDRETMPMDFGRGVLSVSADFKLTLGTQERLTVNGELPGALSSRDGALGAGFSCRDIEQLPLTNGYTLQSLLALVPGVVFTDSVGDLAQFTAAGQRRFSNRLTIDGGTFTNTRGPAFSNWNDSGCPARGISPSRRPAAGSIAANAPLP